MANARKTSRLPADMFDPFVATTRPAAQVAVPTPEPTTSEEVAQAPPEPTKASLHSVPDQVETSVGGAPREAVRPATAARSAHSRRRLTPTSALPPRDYTAGGRPPAPDLRDVAPVRITAYVRPDQLEQLRNEVRQRQGEGRRADVSTLLREAVDLFLSQPPGE